MIKRNNDIKKELLFIVSFVLIGLVIVGFTSLAVTVSDKNEVKKQMNAVSQYIGQQSIRYEELRNEYVLHSLYDISDRTFSIRSMIDYNSADVDKELRSQAEANRLNGILVTETDKESSTEKVVSYYVDRDDDYVLWTDLSDVFDFVGGNLFKSFGERMTVDEYYYDYVTVSRGDGKGVVLCYKRQRIKDVEDDRFSIATLLKGYTFSSGGTIVVTDGQNVIASNDAGNAGILAEDCAVVRRLRQNESLNDLVKVNDEGVYYGIKSKCRNLFIYTYMPESEVFTRRSIVLPYLLLIYVFAVAVVVVVRRMILRKKQLEQKRIDEEYRANNERLAKEAIRANEAKTDFLRRMSHDMRTPINGIRGMVKIGDYYCDDLAKQKECREKIWDASGYLLDLVSDMLDMNKLTTSDTIWKDEPFVMSELLSEIGAFVGIQAKETGISLAIDAREITHDSLLGAKAQFKRILTNLMTNAVKYNKPHGSVTVTCKETGFKDGVVYFECKCTDTGIGMSEKFVKKMYEPFERETQSEGKTLEGVGLGLAIVRKLVDKAGWSISADTKKGAGTEFTLDVFFKVTNERKKSTDERQNEDKNELCGYNILVAEDNELNFEIVDFILKRAGATVIPVADGKQAVEKFKESETGSIDVILMDVMMPVMDGLAATREIRASDRGDALIVPIIAMTANAFADDVENARIVGMNAHIAKPIEADKLINCILHMIKNSEGGDRF